MTLYHLTGIIAASGGAAAKPGMVLLAPTSIAHSGTSASIGANGQVTFTAVTSLSLNGVFSAAYDNYVISARTHTSDGTDIRIRFRVAGTDNSTASSYVRQRIQANSTTVDAVRVTSDLASISNSQNTQRSGFTAALYGPFLAQPTALRSVTVQDTSSAFLADYAVTHNQSTSYDGFTLLTTSPETMTGALQVYGVRS